MKWKVPANSDNFRSSHSLKALDRIEVTVRIKIVGRSKMQGQSGRGQPSAQRSSIRPYDMRIKRDHGGGLWTIEADGGQLYLAVLSREVSDAASENLHAQTVRAGRL
jgi:hypothetical protein